MRALSLTAALLALASVVQCGGGAVSTAVVDQRTQTEHAASMTIVALGDSTTAGTPAFFSPIEAPPDGRGDVTSQYAYWLMRDHAEWTVLNRGVNGERSDQIRARFERDVVRNTPRVVVIIAGVNDIYQGRPATFVQEQLAAMYERAASAGIAVVAGAIIPFNTASADQNARMHEVNDWIRRTAETSAGRIRHCDTRTAVAAPGDPDRLLSSPDQLHPSVEGYRLMAAALTPVIEQAIGAAR